MATKQQLRKEKRDSKQIDKLIAEVDRRHSEGTSVNRACSEVGIQPTVYYFRKRRDQTFSKNSTGPAQSNNYAREYVSKSKDVHSLREEARELENRLRDLKMRIADAVLSE